MRLWPSSSRPFKTASFWSSSHFEMRLFSPTNEGCSFFTTVLFNWQVILNSYFPSLLQHNVKENENVLNQSKKRLQWVMTRLACVTTCLQLVWAHSQCDGFMGVCNRARVNERLWYFCSAPRRWARYRANTRKEDGSLTEALNSTNESQCVFSKCLLTRMDVCELKRS